MVGSNIVVQLDLIKIIGIQKIFSNFPIVKSLIIFAEFKSEFIGEKIFH